MEIVHQAAEIAADVAEGIVVAVPVGDAVHAAGAAVIAAHVVAVVAVVVVIAVTAKTR